MSVTDELVSLMAKRDEARAEVDQAKESARKILEDAADKRDDIIAGAKTTADEGGKAIVATANQQAKDAMQHCENERAGAGRDCQAQPCCGRGNPARDGGAATQ